MSAGDGIQSKSAYVTVQAASSTADSVMSAGAVTDIATAHSATDLHFLLDFKVIISVTNPAADGYIPIFKRNSDQPVPTASYQHTWVGNAHLDTQTGNYYLRGVPNDDELDTYYCLNKSGVTTTIALEARTRTYTVE